jgi:hypothetical protein
MWDWIGKTEKYRRLYTIPVIIDYQPAAASVIRFVRGDCA